MAKLHIPRTIPRAASALTALVSLVLPACSGYDDSTDVAFEAYSPSECIAAHGDVRKEIFTAPLYSFGSSSPQTYSNSLAFKSYIWDVTFRAAPEEVYPFLALDATRINPADYDTPAECTALSFNRRLYRKNYPTSPFVMYADGSAQGVWDQDYGCVLPRYWGPFIHFPDTLGQDSVIRACVSARKADGNTIPVGFSVSGTQGISDEAFQGPVIRIGSRFYPVSADNTSGDQYCKRRGDLGIGIASTAGGCVTGYAYYIASLGAWRAAVTTTCANVWATLNCVRPVTPAL